MPLILPYQSSGDGSFHWDDITPSPNPCTWIVVQRHKMQSKSSDGGGIAKMVRSLKRDPYAAFSFRVITSVKPWMVLAVDKNEDAILDFFRTLVPYLSIYGAPPADLNTLMVRIINDQLSLATQTTSTSSPFSSSSSSYPFVTSSSSSSSSSSASASLINSSTSASSSTTLSSSNPTAPSNSGGPPAAQQPYVEFAHGEHSPFADDQTFSYAEDLHAQPSASLSLMGQSFQVSADPPPATPSDSSPFGSQSPFDHIPVDAQWQLIPKSKGKVALFSKANSVYLRADEDDPSIVNFVTHCRGWEEWLLQHLGADKFSLLSKHGTFLQALPSGVLCQSTTRTEWTIWSRTTLPQGNFAFKSAHGKYLTVH